MTSKVKIEGEHASHGVRALARRHGMHIAAGRPTESVGSRMTSPRLAGPDEQDTPVRGAAGLQSSLMRNLNGSIRELSETYAHPDPIAFVCECRSARCYQAVWVSRAVFDATVADRRGWLLVAGHEPSTPSHPAESSPANHRPDEARDMGGESPGAWQPQPPSAIGTASWPAA